RRIDQLSTIARYAHFLSQERLSRARAQTNQDIRLDGREFGVKPGAAGVDLRTARLFVDAPLSALCGRPLEVLDYIRHVHIWPIHARLDQRPVEKLAGWTYKGASRTIF